MTKFKLSVFEYLVIDLLVDRSYVDYNPAFKSQVSGKFELKDVVPPIKRGKLEENHFKLFGP